MAIKLPSFKMFSITNAKSRVFLLLSVIVSVGLIVFFTVRYFGGNESTSGASRVAAAPSGLQSVPGGQLSPEYYRALMEANAQSAQQAQMTGSSAVPTMVNVASPATGFQQQSTQSCTILCPNTDNVNVENDINDLIKGGKLPQKDANMLLALAKNNVPIDEYAAALAQLVKEGKLTPEQARKLLEQYKKQHQNTLLRESAVPMDALIKSGQLPLDIANQLLTLQKNNASSAEYGEELAHLVKEGKLAPTVAAQLLAQYTQQRAREATKKGIFELKQLAKAGAITAAVANSLAEMQAKNVPLDQYAAELQRLVAEGKMTPAEAARLLAEYKARRGSVGATMEALETLIQQQEALCQQDTAQQKKGGVQGSPTVLPSCQKLVALKEHAKRLMALQTNNATPAAYAEELKRGVQAGLLTPEGAASLLQSYQATVLPVEAGTSVPTTLPTTADFARLQQAVQSQAAVQSATTPAQQAEAAQFAAAAAQVEQQAQQDRMQRIQQLQADMATQAQTLVASWQPPKMVHQGGTTSTQKSGSSLFPNSGSASQSGTKGTSTTSETADKALIKAGTVMFGVLETAVDSDYPDTPVLVSIVQGPFKGAKLLGKLALAQGQDRVSLSFTLMDQNEWPKTKSITAFAIDPDTARTVMATNVDHHYWMRYGSLFASSFLTGYATGVQNAGNSTTGIFGTSTTNPKLSFGNNVAVALGQVGTAFTTAVQNNVNTAATVKVRSGVGLGILFMSDVT